MRRNEKPMLIRFSTLGRRWYAFNAYRLNKDGKTLTVTGKKHDITDQMEQIIREQVAMAATPETTREPDSENTK